MTRLPVRAGGRFAMALLVGLAVAAIAPRASAQCQVLNSPVPFDPPASGVPSPLRPTNDSMGISGSARRLVVRYNYGYLTYSLAVPAAPSVQTVQNLLSVGYPKSGDGQTRTGKIALSPDGQRVALPWTDEIGYGTITQAFGSGGFGPGGDYLPAGYNSNHSAIVKVGSSYLGFTASALGVYAANVTNVVAGPGSAVRNGIPSEKVTALGTDLSGLEAVEGPSRKWVVGSSQSRVVVIDATDAGSAPVPGIAAALTWREHPAAALGVPSGSYINNVAAVAHPSDGALHILVESARYIRPYTYSTFVSLHRVDPANGNLTTVGSFVPQNGQNLAQKGMVLLAFDSDVVAFLMHRLTAGGMRLQARASLAFGTNLAASSATITNPPTIGSLVGFRSTGGNVHLYLADGGFAYAMSLDCSAAPGPAAAFLSVDRVPTNGAATTVPDGGSVFVGDELRVKPAFSPPDSVSPLVDWRLDYDFHDGNALDSQAAAMRLLNADESRTKGPALPPGEYTLIGPCDPARVPQGGPAPVPSTGAGCWPSVTTNDTYGMPAGTPDFSASAPADKELTLALEVQNSFNSGGSSVARHRITWKVPRQLLKSSSILSGGALEDASEGSPAATGFRWYVARVPVGETGADVLTLEPACTGPACAPAFTQAGQASPGLQRPGSYRFWASTPYRGGFRTAECPDLQGDQVTCAGDAARTVNVSEVVLALSAPASISAATPSVTFSSSSRRARVYTECPSSPGFSFDTCEVLGGSCAEGDYVAAGVTVTNPFPASGTGTISIPTPSRGDWGVRIRYTYSTDGSCDAPRVAQWPETGYWPLTVVPVPPTVRLRNLANTADVSSFNGKYGLTTYEQARAYAWVNGEEDTSPPALSWSYRPVSGGAATQLGTSQGQTFSIPTAGDYEITLTGYGTDATATVLVDPPAGGGGGDAPVVTGVAFSKTAPAISEAVTVSCQATPGTHAIGTYSFAFGDGQAYSGPSASADHAWATEGTKAVSCIAYDVNGLPSAPLSAYIDVGGPATGPTVTSIDVTPPYLRPGLLATLTCSATAPAGRVVAGYEFDFGDSTSPVSGPSNVVTHTFGAPGTFQATCRAYDWSGRSGSLQRAVTILEASYALTISKAGSGSGLVSSTPPGLNCGPVCDATFQSGSSVRLEALPSAGSRFAGWSEPSCPGVDPCTVVLTASLEVVATFSPTSGTRFNSVTPCRIADTRNGSGVPLAAGEVREFPVIGAGCDVPAGSEAAALNVSVTDALAVGSVTLFPAGIPAPGTETVSFSPRKIRSSSAVIKIGIGGAVSAYNGSGGPVHVILDVSGAFQ